MLKVLGVAFLALLAAVIAGVAWIVFKVRRHLRRLARTAALADGLGGPQLLLEPCNDVSWPNPDTVAALRSQVLATGARHIGDFAVAAAMGGTYLSVFLVEAANAFVIIYDNQQLEPWADAVVSFSDDSSYTASSATSFGSGAARPPEDELEHFPAGTPVATLIATVQAKTLGREVATATAEDFQQNFETLCEKHRQFIASQPVKQEWLEAVAENAGVTLEGDEAEELERFREERRTEELEQQCIKELAASGGFNAVQWDAIRDHLVVVHDGIPAAEITLIFDENAELDNDQRERAEKLKDSSFSPRVAIAQFNMTLPEKARLKLVRSMDAPMQADIYINQLDYVGHDAGNMQHANA